MELTAFLDGLPAAREAFNRRLSLVRDVVRGVSRGYYPGLYLYGPPGTGKTFTVMKTLAAGNRLVKYHKGHITAIGLFELLDEYSEGVVVLDDVAEIFSSPVGLQIFLAALGRSPEDAELPGTPNARIVSYKRKGVAERSVFTGGLIAISNLELHDGGLLDAIKSRADCIRYAPTDQEIAALMLDIADKGHVLERPRAAGGGSQTTLSAETCREVALFLIEESLRLCCRFDLRVLVDKSFPKRLQQENGDADNCWKDLVLMSLEERLTEPQHTPVAARIPRQEPKIVRRLLDSGLPHAEQLAQWRSLTGKSPRAFYRWQERLKASTDTVSGVTGSVSVTSLTDDEAGDDGVCVSGSVSVTSRGNDTITQNTSIPQPRWEASGFCAQDLRGGCLFYTGQLPGELIWDDMQFEEAWQLRPSDRPVIRMLARNVAIPRHQQAYGKDYHFSGQTSPALPLPPLLEPLLAWTREAVDSRMNGLLLNWYDGPDQYIGAHHDSVRQLADGAPIVTLSFGETRTFRLSKKGSDGDRLTRDFPATNGTAFILPRDTNDVWKHAVPKSARYRGRRISVTVRAFADDTTAAAGSDGRQG